MIIILAILDILAAGVLILQSFKFELPGIGLIVAALYLMAKLFIFPLNIAGIVDFIAGILILLSFFVTLPKFLVIIFAGWILIKAGQSFLH